MDSIITQVNREDEQLGVFSNDKGNWNEKYHKIYYFGNIF